jgi:hypothetical protein
MLTATGEMLATAGDDGNVLLWVPSENPAHNSTFGEDAQDDVETWRVLHHWKHGQRCEDIQCYKRYAEAADSSANGFS